MISSGLQRPVLRQIVQSVQSAIDPYDLLLPKLDELDLDRKHFVIGAGKAAARMAQACEQKLPNVAGMTITPYGYGLETRKIEVVEAAHPVPDRTGLSATTRLLEKCKNAKIGDSILLLLSGGASSLLVQPVGGVSLEEKVRLTKSLLRCGASIGEVNTVRKHLSEIKGGRLAAALPNISIKTYAISDVPNDDPSVIGSGPTVPDPSTLEDAIATIAKYNMDVPPSILVALNESANETPKYPANEHHVYDLIAGPQNALEAARKVTESLGYHTVVAGIEQGEACEVGKRHFHLAAQHAAQGRRVALISGGELSVTLENSPGNKGGRCREYSLAIVDAANGQAPWLSGAVWDTDGIDGTKDGAGAFFFADTIERAQLRELGAADYLTTHNSGTFFTALGDTLVTGPTFTNVGDMRILLIDPYGY